MSAITKRLKLTAETKTLAYLENDMKPTHNDTISFTFACWSKPRFRVHLNNRWQMKDSEHVLFRGKLMTLPAGAYKEHGLAIACTKAGELETDPNRKQVWYALYMLAGAAKLQKEARENKPLADARSAEVLVVPCKNGKNTAITYLGTTVYVSSALITARGLLPAIVKYGTNATDEGYKSLLRQIYRSLTLAGPSTNTLA